jgi:hypothetical protein
MKKLMNKYLLVYREKVASFIRDPFFLSFWDKPYLRSTDNNRITSRLSPEGYRWPGNHYRGIFWMFLEDMHNGIMPFMHVLRRGTPSPFTARLEPTNQSHEAILAQALGGERHHGELSDALCEFVRQTTQSLFVYGKVSFEVIVKKDSDGNIVELDFDDIFPLSLKKFFGQYYQVVPWWIARHANVKVDFVKIPNDKLFCINFPRGLGGRRRYVKTLKRLVELGDSIPPKFYLSQMEQNKDVGFDFKMYLKDRYIETAQITKRFGWHQRKLPDDEVLEYYAVYRHLRFEYGQAIVREAIMEKLNEVLKSLSPAFNEQIVFEGIPTSKQIRDEIDLLEKGDLSFSDQYQRVSV